MAALHGKGCAADAESDAPQQGEHPHLVHHCGPDKPLHAAPEEEGEPEHEDGVHGQRPREGRLVLIIGPTGPGPAAASDAEVEAAPEYAGIEDEGDEVDEEEEPQEDSLPSASFGVRASLGHLGWGEGITSGRLYALPSHSWRGNAPSRAATAVTPHVGQRRNMHHGLGEVRAVRHVWQLLAIPGRAGRHMGHMPQWTAPHVSFGSGERVGR
jgi:hypothetical protein